MAGIPNRAVFRSQEVCEIVEVQPYVLRSWEAEFPDLGLSKSAGGPRVYRRSDLERVQRLKHLLFVEGLTLAGARKQLGLETAAGPVAEADAEDTVSNRDVAAMLDKQTQRGLRDVRQGLEWILGLLNGRSDAADEFRLTPPARPGAAKKKAVHVRPAKPIRLKASAKPARAKAAKPALKSKAGKTAKAAPAKKTGKKKR